MIGDVIEQIAAGVRHSYRLMATRPHTDGWGHPDDDPLWSGTCAVCGAPFETTTSRTAHYLARTCPAHRGEWRR